MSNKFSFLAVSTVVCALALTSQSVLAQTTVFSDQFSAGSTVNGTPGTPTATSTTYESAMGNTTGSSVSLNPNDLNLTSANTSSGFNEIQAQFTATPLTLVNPGNYIDFSVTFVATSNILSSAVGVNSTLAIGLYNSGGVAPLQGNTLLNGSATPTGGTSGWVGYNGRMLQSGTAQLYSRTAQTSTFSRNQDLLFNNASTSLTYNTPVGSVYGTKSSVGSVLVNGDTYTMDYRLTLTATGTIAGTNTLYSGAGTGGTILFALGGTTNGTLSTTFDGLAFGYRVSAASATQAALDINSIDITTNIVPEPSTVALVGAGFGLMMMAIRRRRR